MNKITSYQLFRSIQSRRSEGICQKNKNKTEMMHVYTLWAHRYKSNPFRFLFFFLWILLTAKQRTWCFLLNFQLLQVKWIVILFKMFVEYIIVWNCNILLQLFHHIISYKCIWLKCIVYWNSQIIKNDFFLFILHIEQINSNSIGVSVPLFIRRITI